MPAAIFFERDEINGDLLAQNLLEAKADAVIWYSPDRECRRTLALLRDAGVRVIGVRDWVLPPVPCRYEIHRENALRAILRAWRAAGLTSTIVLGEPRGRSAIDEETCHSASANEKLPSEILTVKENQLRRTLGRLLRKENRGFLLTASAAALCAVRAPHVLWDLMEKRRVALVDGPISLLFGKVPAVPVDLVTVDWEGVTGHITADLISQTAWEKKKSFVFHGEANLRVPLNHFCHEI